MPNNNNNNIKFRNNNAIKWKNVYADDVSMKKRFNQSARYKYGDYATAKEVREALTDGISNRETIVETSKKLYSTNPIYATVIDYISNIYCWRYKVIPHQIDYTKTIPQEEYQRIYNLMLEVVDGLSIETKFPAILSLLYISGGVYFTTVYDENTITIDTILLPDKYCKKIGETQYGTNIIQFDYSYFQSLGLTKDKLDILLESFPKEMQKGYNLYLKEPQKMKWQTLDPRFSSALLLNELSIPTYLYLLGGILDYEKYQDNELERNENLLKYLVIHEMPHYEDNLIFDGNELKDIHDSLRKIVDVNGKARLITTYGKVYVERVAEDSIAENEVLSKSFSAIFNNAGFNSEIFTGNSVESTATSLIRDKTKVWKHIQSLLNFYTIAINNWYQFGDLQANIEILPISIYTYNDDIKVYKDNATIGVGKLDYLIASGIKQKNIADQLYLESLLGLDKITPMQTSYTQTAEDRKDEQDAQDENNIDVITGGDENEN